jgi:eukaryotic-like serine/threonine-protein kinase
MEYLEGGDLAAWLRQRGALPIEQAVEFVLQACVAVADAHALGIVHRDLKPGNLFCVRRSDGQLSIKVLDFGISKVTDPRGADPDSVTRTSALMGSPLYMSPEQMRSSRDVDARTDLWALGVILFELMTGRPPFKADTVTELAIKVANEPTPAIRSLRPGVPDGLQAAIFKCLQKDRQARYRHVAELALALLPFGPKRAKASVERISGIVQAAGLSASALDLPPSPQPRAETVLAPETVAPFGRTAAGETQRKTLWGAGLVGAFALAAIAGAILFKGELGRPESSPAVSAGLVTPAVSTVVPALSLGATPNLAPPPATATPGPVDLVMPTRTPVPAPPGPAADAVGRQGSAAEPATPGPADRTGWVAVPPAVNAAGLPRVASPQGGATSSKKTSSDSTSPSAAAASPASLAPAPCKLVRTLDSNGEVHFSCPCATCQ